MRRLSSFALLASLSATFACDPGSSQEPETDPGSSDALDASTRGDASSSADTGSIDPPDDAGDPPDAPESQPDTGSSPVDMGAGGEPDVGTAPVDMGRMDPVVRVTDDFSGDGPLLDYVTNNPNSLPDVARVGGRYRANLVDNTDNITLHFNQDQGRLDAKRLAFPFDYVARNIGIGTQADSQVAPVPDGNAFVFAGVQVHVLDLEARDSSHVVVGHRGSTRFTIEGKNTVAGDSAVNDIGAMTAPEGRADIRIVGNPDRTLTVYWQLPNPNPEQDPDSWTLYRGNGTLPGPAPAYGDEVYVGLITYAYQQRGVPFVGTCDGVELAGE